MSDARGWSNVWYSSKDDTHPPMHAMALRGWRMIFGEGDVAARSLSAFFSCLAILALFGAVRSLHASTAALWAAAIMAVASPQIEFAQETRSYAMVAFLTLWMTAILLRIETRSSTRLRCVALFLVTTAALLTHYAAIPYSVALFIYAIIRLPRRELRNTSIALVGAATVFVLAWGSIALSQRGAMSANLTWLADDGPGFVLRWLTRLATLPLRLFITPMSKDRDSAVGLVSATFYLSPLLLFVNRNALIWCLIGGACVGAVAMSDLFQERQALDWTRYTLIAAPALYAIIGSLPTLGRDQKTMKLLRLVPAVFVIGCVLSLPEAYSRYWKADFRGFAQDFDRVAGNNDLIITHAATRGDWKNAILLAALSHYSKNPHHPTLILTRPFEASLPSSDAWFISTQTDLDIPSWLHEGRSVEQISIPFVGTMYHIRIATSQPSTVE